MVGSNRGSSGNNKRKVFRYAGKKFPFARKVVRDAVPCVLSQEKLSGTPSLASFRKKSCRGRRPLRPFARKVVRDAVPCVLSREKLPGTPSLRTFRAIWGWGLRGKGNLTSSYPSPIIFDIFFDKTNKTTAAQALMATKSIKKS